MTMTETQKTPIFVTMVYMGRRLSGRDELLYAWRYDEHDEESFSGDVSYYKKLKGEAIGSRYTIEMNRETHSVSPGTLTFEEARAATDDEMMEWEVADRASVQRRQHAQAEKKAAKQNDRIAEAVEPLRVIYKAAATWQDRKAILDIIMNEVTR